MPSWPHRHPVLTWALAWALPAFAWLIGNAGSVVRAGSVGPGVALGVVAWGFAGATTFPDGRFATRFLTWAAAFGLAFWLASAWGNWFEHHTVGPFTSAGFIGALLGWAAGAAAGALATALAVGTWRGLKGAWRALAFAGAWGLGVLLGGYAGLIAALILGDLVEIVLGASGIPRFGLALGGSLGVGLGGLLASALGLSAWRRLFEASGPFQ